MAKTKAPYQLVIRYNRFSPRRLLRWSLEDAALYGEIIAKYWAGWGERVSWQVIRRSDKVVVAQSK